MKTLMIHEVKPEFLNLDLSEFDIITFDDGLYTQYLNAEHFKKFNKRIIFFISSNIICKDEKLQSKELIHCADAHKKAFSGNFENYMTLNQIQNLQSNGFEIGAHGANHSRFNVKLKDFKEIIKDTQECLNFWKTNGISIKSFCFPYNQNLNNRMYENYIKHLGLEYFGYERISIESLL